MIYFFNNFDCYKHPNNIIILKYSGDSRKKKRKSGSINQIRYEKEFKEEWNSRTPYKEVVIP